MRAIKYVKNVHLGIMRHGLRLEVASFAQVARIPTTSPGWSIYYLPCATNFAFMNSCLLIPTTVQVDQVQSLRCGLLQHSLGRYLLFLLSWKVNRKFSRFNNVDCPEKSKVYVCEVDHR